MNKKLRPQPSKWAPDNSTRKCSYVTKNVTVEDSYSRKSSIATWIRCCWDVRGREFLAVNGCESQVCYVDVVCRRLQLRQTRRRLYSKSGETSLSWDLSWSMTILRHHTVQEHQSFTRSLNRPNGRPLTPLVVVLVASKQCHHQVALVRRFRNVRTLRAVDRWDTTRDNNW